jgi:hypothetical protein
VCIAVDKIYDECKNVQVETIEFTFEADPENPVEDVICLNVEIVAGPTCEVVNSGRVRVTTTFSTTVRVILQDGTTEDLTQETTVIKTFNMPRAGENGLVVVCDIPFLECLQAFVQSEELEYGVLNTTIIACVGKYTVLRLLANVQLMIPAYGFCPEPPDCEEVLSECPDFSPQWPPYPVQSR